MNLFKRNNIQRNQKGSIAIEFAILLPLLLLMFFGAFEVARYVIVSRKIDNTANDIAFIFSREGDLYLDDKGNPRPFSQQGAGLINYYTKSLVPMLMYPFTANDYALDVRYVGLPTNTTVNPNFLRVMWAHGVCGSGKPISLNGLCSGTTSTQDLQLTIAPFTQTEDCTSNTEGGLSCVYYAKGLERAKVLVQGQAYVLVNFSYKYNMILNKGTATGDSNLTKTIERIATYPARSKWIDGSNGSPLDGLVQGNEYSNHMYKCTNCYPYNSTVNGLPSPGGSTTRLRSNCITITPQSSQEIKDTRGCIFN